MISTPLGFFSRSLALFACLTLLTGCVSMGGQEESLAPQSSPTAPAPQSANVIGQGSVKAALILPLSGTGNAAAAGKAMRNGAEMALAEFNNPNVQIIVKDDGGTAQGASAAAQAAVQEGAQIILGPLFAQAASAAGQSARAANVPVIAFSTDTNVAGPGLYLLSFLPQSDVERIVQHAVKSGKRSFAALLPDNAYGSVVEGAFQEAVAKAGGRVVALERYASAQDMQGAVQRVAQATKQADALFMPDNADNVPGLVAALQAGGVDLKRLTLLGTGQWDDPRIMSQPALSGALFAAPDSSGYRAFAERYRARYGETPIRTATLAYDAVLLTAALTQSQGEQRFSEGTLTNPSGFQGMDGLFRFRGDGTNERGLAVMQIEAGAAKVVSPAPKTFAGGKPGL